MIRKSSPRTVTASAKIPEDDATPSKAPLPIWLYWENLPNQCMPTYLKMCYETVIQNCPSASVTLVTPETLHNFLPNLRTDLDTISLKNPDLCSIALKVDYVRVALLHEYGGLWLDIDCIVIRDFVSEILNILEEFDFYGMQKTATSMLVTNNFMASRRDGVIVGEYLEKIDAILDEKLGASEQFDWMEIGAGLLTPIVEKNRSICYLDDERNIHPVHFANADQFWNRNDRLIDLNVIPDSAKVVMLYNAMFTEEQRRATRRQILNSNTLLGALMRRSFPNETLSALPNNKPKEELQPRDIEVIFTTMDRPESCLNFVKSIREFLGNEISVHFAAQGPTHEAYAEAEKAYNCRVTYVPHDFGLSASRNLLFEKTQKPLIFLCEDDFLFDKCLNLSAALEVLDLREDIGVLGGLFENNYHDDSSDSPREFIDPCLYIRKMDSVNDFALFRRELFSEYGLRWKSDRNIAGEHATFYSDFQNIIGDALKVYYTNALISQRHRHSNSHAQRYCRQIRGKKRAKRRYVKNLGIGEFFIKKLKKILTKRKLSI